MFTGLVQERGEVLFHDAARGIEVRAPKTTASLRPGGSVSVAGVCVTAEHVEGDRFGATLCAETQRRSTLGELEQGETVNLERPIVAGTPSKVISCKATSMQSEK